MTRSEGDLVLGEKLRTYRELAGRTQRDVAKMLHVSSSMLQHIENGHRNPSTLFLRRAAGMFQVSADELLGLGTGGRRRCPECLGKGWVYGGR